LFTVAEGKAKVGVADMVGDGVMVGVNVVVGEKVRVGVKVNVRVGVSVQAAAVAVMEVAVSNACSSGEGPQEIKTSSAGTISQKFFI
jgi:acyl-[acyl carrier protein]--UDP-N-acetylglucosamine O-acyltransferase